ncbi:eukaryotic translation initiation factor 3 subunit M-like [Eurytemora carolleeae]|uniref:eukaryotic translation initiation factor 3 subunit M-like n=1 Tax=Eurytemora carolleeae TaxID=1294199 RepID=UPI000C786C07|nr:eukaryotic translation initiation factor 3 subunit M-like [Eurytemora carolleeae]|eukprot:XP_023323141.1 eukaryotic translation initiation factor 3 subunit M-like [Eurytemora affinis]
MNVPVFIDINQDEQVEELRAYFKSLGADISEEKSELGLEDDLQKIIGVCDVCFNSAAESDVEGIMNGIVSMLALITKEELIISFCEKLSKAPTQQLGMVCLKVLWFLFMSLDDNSSMRFQVYYYLVGVAGRTHQLHTVYKDMATTKTMFNKAPPSSDQVQKLYRLLHEMLLLNGKSDDASRVMVELLGTYTTENASQAREEAQRCIIASLADPNTFLLDHLLQLKPVKFLEGELIHQLLSIFVGEKLDAYIKFYQQQKEFVNGLGLKHEDNLRKMKLLSFMQMAENRSEITFAEVKDSMQLNENEVEEFLIDVIKTRLVRAKISQGDGVVYVSSTMHRTFGTGDWQQLHSLLLGWKTNLHSIKEHMAHIASTQVELMHKKN